MLHMSLHHVVSIKIFKTIKNNVEEIGTYFSRQIEIEDKNGSVYIFDIYSNNNKGELSIQNEAGYR